MRMAALAAGTGIPPWRRGGCDPGAGASQPPLERGSRPPELGPCGSRRCCARSSTTDVQPQFSVGRRLVQELRLDNQWRSP